MRQVGGDMILRQSCWEKLNLSVFTTFGAIRKDVAALCILSAYFLKLVDVMENE